MNYFSYDFGIFRLFPDSERLFAGDVELSLGHRAVRVLSLLLERRGDIVKHRELIAHAWPENIVEDNNLRVQVAAIRKVLREHDPEAASFLKNVAGCGYRFLDQPGVVATVTTVEYQNTCEPVETVKPSSPTRSLASHPAQKRIASNLMRRAVRSVNAVREGHIGHARRFLVHVAERRHATRTALHIDTDRTERALKRQSLMFTVTSMHDSSVRVPETSAEGGDVSNAESLETSVGLRTWQRNHAPSATSSDPELRQDD